MSQQRRNVVTIVCDQLRPDFLHAYGADFIPTPNIDALAEHGVVFDNAITASTVCAPARMSFLTGLPVSGHDAWTNEIPAKPGTEYLPERLSAAGYMTAAVGVYDHAPYDKPLGYQYRKLFIGGAAPDQCDYTKEFFERHPEANTLFMKGEDGHYLYSEEEYFDRWCADRAVEFIESYTETGKAPDGTAPATENAPFFLYCGFFAPHGPLLPPSEVIGTIDPEKLPLPLVTTRPDEDIPAVELYRRAYLNPHEALTEPERIARERLRDRVLYAEMIVEVDALVGRIIDALKRQGIWENTTVIFSSDHGSCENDYNMSTKGPWPYHPQLFIPMIISNHPELSAGTHCDALCGGLDLGATVLEIAGDEKAFGLSRSMIGLSTGRVPEREVNMSEFCDACKTLVDKRYTFTYYPFTGRTCLFDRVEDPEEHVNLGGRAEVADIERKFLMHVIDMMVLAKGVRLEAHDLVPEIREGLEKKHPKFMDNFDIAYPIASMRDIERIREAGLDADYQEFCKTKPIKAHYGVYFQEK